jgi:tellurite resistance protein
MAACALVSMADGSVSLRERVRLDRLMETLDALKVFDPHEGVEIFNEFVAALERDTDRGRRQILHVVAAETEGDTEKALLLARICLAVSEKNGHLPGVARREIGDLCRTIGVDPVAAGLDRNGTPIGVADRP